MKQKPDKPYPDFPLFPHDNGQWAKKIRKKLHYFGVWEDWEKAGAEYERKREALYAGREPTPDGSITVYHGCNVYIAAKESLLSAGDIVQRTFQEYEETCELLIDTFGDRSIASLVPADFDDLRKSLGKRLGPVRLSNQVSRIRGVFLYLADDAVRAIDRLPRFGPNFRRASAKVLRLAEDESGDKVFTPEEIRSLLDKANSQMKAMILLGINCGCGNEDIARLQYRHIDLRTGWVKYTRHKTGIRRKAKLWDETVRALENVPHHKALPDVNADLFFVTRFGNAWHSDQNSPIAKEFAKLLKVCKIRRKGLSFYALRHTFQTIGDESLDLPAVRSVMGHVPPRQDMSNVYRGKITDERLCAVAKYVHQWVYKVAKKVSSRVSPKKSQAS